MRYFSKSQLLLATSLTTFLLWPFHLTQASKTPKPLPVHLCAQTLAKGNKLKQLSNVKNQWSLADGNAPQHIVVEFPVPLTTKYFFWSSPLLDRAPEAAALAKELEDTWLQRADIINQGQPPIVVHVSADEQTALEEIQKQLSEKSPTPEEAGASPFPGVYGITVQVESLLRAGYPVLFVLEDLRPSLINNDLLRMMRAIKNAAASGDNPDHFYSIVTTQTSDYMHIDRGTPYNAAAHFHINP